ncbi:MAG: hypothetical protein QM813_13845 [Verrucomicrobiota bacterium]
MKTGHIKHNTRFASLRSTWASPCALAVAIIALATSSSWAQSVVIRSQPLRLTIPKGVPTTNTITLTIVTASLPTPSVNLSVTDVPGSGNAFATLSQTTIAANATTTVTLTLTNDATLNGGNYDMAVVATGDASFRLPIPITCTYVWSGANYANGTSTNWSSAGNWQGGIVPGASDAVVFANMGAVTNSANSVPGGGTPNTLQTAPIIATNVIVSADTTVGAIRFAQQTNTSRAFHFEIQSGATLSVTGPGGFSILRDNKFVSQQSDVKFSGAGKLKVDNINANINYLIDGQGYGLWDMRSLASFEANVNRLGLGDFREFPNYYTNGSVGTGATEASFASRFVPYIYLALTNVIKASYVDPNNYLDPGVRTYALTLGNNETQGTGSGQVLRFSFGLSNAVFLDSICFGASGAVGNPHLFNFNATNSYALFRGITGLNSRITAWVQADGSGTNSSGSNSRGAVDFGNGKVDVLVDRLYLSRVRTNHSGITFSSSLTIGGASPGSIFDVNTAYLGIQEYPNLATTVTSAANSPSGTVTVNSNATFKVNGTLHLGYTTTSPTGTPNYPENCSGILNISSNGTVMASNILAGGVSKLSVANNIFMNRGRLIVTNGIGDVTKAVNLFTITNGSQLTVHNVSDTAPSIYVTTLNAANIGSASLVNIPALTNTIWPVTIPLISYVTANPNIAGLIAGTLPSGVVLQTIVDSNAGLAPNGTINFTFTTNTPKVLVWTGAANGNWDTISSNWVTQVGGTPTRFTDGDSVVFGNSSAVNAITVVGSVTPGQTAAAYGITITNDASHNYSFTGGAVGGSANGYKAGAGSLTVNASFSPGFTIEAGSLVGNGTLGTTVLGSGTTMTGFSGTINNGLSVSSATVNVTGTVNGGLNLISGSLINFGSINGLVNIADGVTLDNRPGATMTVILPWTISTNTTLINNGSIYQVGTLNGNLGMNVDGTLKGVGLIGQNPATQLSSDVRVTIRAGGTLMIGNSPNEITNMTIGVRLDLNAGSTVTFDVDNTGPRNDKIILVATPYGFGKVNFGVGNNQGGTIFVNRVAGPAFDAATSLLPFDQTSNPPDNANPAIPKITPQPALGLVWNTAEVITNLTLNVVPLPQITNTVTSTNFVFEWPASYRGWRVERQISTLDVGLESPSTNWNTLFTALGGTNASIYYYPDITNQPDVFWVRQTVPIDKTNAAVFYRTTYP